QYAVDDDRRRLNLASVLRQIAGVIGPRHAQSRDVGRVDLIERRVPSVGGATAGRGPVCIRAARAAGEEHQEGEEPQRFFHKSIGFVTPLGRNGSAIFFPSPADAYAAYSTSCTTRPVSPSAIGFSLPRTQRAKCRISCGKP